jgi:Mn2+/Fe2+ NRAMP family transporter
MPTDAIQEPPESLAKALLKIGPGIILAGSIVGSGELIATTALGADWGFMFLWLILFSCVIKVFVQIELGRYAISSGKPTLGALNELPGLRFGAHWQVWWWFFMLMATVVQLGAMVGGVAQALQLAIPGFGAKCIELAGGDATGLGRMLIAHPEHPWAVLTALAAVVLLLSGGYAFTEKLTTILVVGVTAITVACVIALPATGYPIQLSEVLRGFAFEFPSDPTNRAKAIAKAFAVFGITGVGAAELYAYPYWCLEKGYARFVGPRSDDPAWARRANGWLRVMHLDAWVSMLVFTLATVSFYFLGATVLHRQNIHPEGTKMIATLAEMYVPAFGDWTKILFLIGAWAVLFKTLYVASAGHSRLSADFFSLAGFLQYSNAYSRRRMIRIFCVFFPMLALTFYLWLGEPQSMVIFGGFVQGITLPVISGAALYLRYTRTDSRIAPNKLTDLCLWLAFGLMLLFGVKALWDKAAPLMQPPQKKAAAGQSRTVEPGQSPRHAAIFRRRHATMLTDTAPNAASVKVPGSGTGLATLPSPYAYASAVMKLYPGVSRTS